MKVLVSLGCLVGTLFSFAQVDLDYYLPAGLTYDPKIPTPREVLGFEVGEWHSSHDQLVAYLRVLAEASDRLKLEEYARSYEKRPLIVLKITSPENHENLEEIRKTHVSLSNPYSDVTSEASKLVLWLGYSVHGNEASGANASLLTAYYLAAAQGDKIDQMLNETVILLDPCFNPDGLQRFSNWVNMHKSKNLVTDPNAREFDEAWPGGRTNHYWFDLNRDWMPVQHPESKGRIKLFHQWKPNVLTDHHEMGTNATFFFQPGIPSRKNPWTPESNVTLTSEIAEYHAKALDAIGSLYYSKESFDDFYVGKGSTYPDLNGSIGILFEQASARGHAQESQFGVVTFPFAIRNHFTSTLSTLEASVDLKTKLLDHQKTFYSEALSLARKDVIKGYVFGSETDPEKVRAMIQILQSHQIEVLENTKALNEGGNRFSPGTSFIVPTQQPQYRLIKSLFEKRTSFQDSLFYDVSAWTLPLTFNIPYAEVKETFKGDPVGPSSFQSASVQGEGSYAFLFKLDGYYSHRAIYRLLKENIIVQISHRSHQTKEGSFGRGFAVVPMGPQKEDIGQIEKMMTLITEEDGINVIRTSTGLALSGSDLGSRNIEVIEKPEVAVLVGRGVSSYEAGEVWHLLDQRFDIPVTLLPISSFGSIDLSKYNKLVMTHGSYGSLNSHIEKLKKWVSNGGTLVAWKGAGKWLADKEVIKMSYLKKDKDSADYRRYVDLSNTRGAQVIGGAIFEAEIDLGHPLSYGASKSRVPLFRNHTYFIDKSKNPYANPLRYTDAPLMSGYVSEENLKKLKGGPAATVSKIGSGRVVVFADNPNFRAFWYGTNKLFMNALFFGSTIDSRASE